MTRRERDAEVALVVCGSLVRQVREVLRRRGWDADLYALDAVNHLHPDRLVEEIERKLVELDVRYRRTVVVYGDCGTMGRLDQVLERFGAVRPEGLHCYELLAGGKFAEITASRPGTYFLTPWMVRNFRRKLLPGMGLDRHPELIPDYFGNYTHVVYLRQYEDADLDRVAGEIALLLGLELEIIDTGLDELTRRLAAVVETARKEEARWTCNSSAAP